MLRPMVAVLFMFGVWAGGTAAQQISGEVEIDSPSEGRKTITPDWQKINAQPLGSRGNPVRASGWPGISAYLQRLRCVNGGAVEVRLIGPAGIGPYTTIVETFEIECDGDLFAVYVDQHHPGYVERRPPARFAIRDP